MKIIRFVSTRKKICYGIYSPEKPNRAKIIEGDILAGGKVSSREVAIGRLLAPINPPNILALGINYRKHGDETAMSYPEEPLMFIKASSSIARPEEAVKLPAAGPDCVDYEAELAVVIGRKAKNLTPAEALDHILGYTCANDISARDWQLEKQQRQWSRGKSFDTFCPLGPWITTKDEISNPDNLRIRAILNGKTLQDSNTAGMIFGITEIISRLSRSMTLLPGTVILTGTPEGVGFTRKPPIYLRTGDVISVDIEKIGRLTNRVILENEIR